jgi:hypothetical protein
LRHRSRSAERLHRAVDAFVEDHQPSVRAATSLKSVVTASSSTKRSGTLPQGT